MSETVKPLPKVAQLALRTLPWIILASGLIASVPSCQRIHDRYRLETDGIAVSGVVVWSSNIGTGTSNQSFRIKVAYRDAAAREWTRFFTVFSSQYRTGETVDLVYLPTDPEIAMLGGKEAGETHGQDLLAAGISALAVLAGGILVWLRRKRLQSD